MEVRPDDPAATATLETARSVVPEACYDSAQRLGTRFEHRSPRVVLEPGQRSPNSGLELAFEQDVADHPALSGNGVERKDTGTGQFDSQAVPVEPTEKLVATTNGQTRRPSGHRLA